MRIELPLVALFTLIWAMVAAEAWSLVHFAGRFDPGLYGLYGLAGLLGSIAGNVYVFRRLQGAGDRLSFATWLGGPPSLIFLLWALVPNSVRFDMPLVPLWATGVYGIFFAVPLSMRRR